MLNRLFDEVSGLNDLLKKTPSDVLKTMIPRPSGRKTLPRTTLLFLYKLIGIVFSIPISNALLERAFSLVFGTVYQQSNSLGESAVKPILQVKVNLDKIQARSHVLRFVRFFCFIK